MLKLCKLFCLFLILKLGFGAECGIPDRKFISEPVPGTEEILQQGKWPWLAAIYVHTTGSQYEFRCGGSVISSQIVITGALCLFNNGVPLKPENIDVYLGQTNLDNRKEEFTYPVKEIHIHKNYNHSIISRDSNIGALKLSRKVRFSNVIKPVCITDSPKNDYVNQAFIAGWGRRDSYTIDNHPRRVSATVIGRRQCLSSNPIYEKLVSLTSFCAGDRNGLGPCLGDSGNGLMIKQNGRWILYGIATTALADPETKLCLPDEYVVYTSVEKFYAWINAIEMNTPFGTRMSNPSKTYDLNVENCGDSSSFIRLIFKGSEIIRGSWPWLVPIYKTKGAAKFICGGTLISKKVIISAAHCFKDGNISLEPKDVLIPIGRHDLDSSEDFQKIPIQIIFVHSDYNPGVLTSDADIALIVLSRNVRFTEFVRPACIWNVDDDAEGETGYVAGWGRVNKNKDRSSRPRSIQATVVPETRCLRSGDAFRQITSNRTFCAGELDGSGPCSGDSGGGLMILKNGRWHLRGIVSISLLKALHECDLHNYVVYTDVAKYLDWIKKIMDKL